MSVLELICISVGSGLTILTIGLCTCIRKSKRSVEPDGSLGNCLENEDNLSSQAKKSTSNRRLPEIPPSSVSSPDENFNRTVQRDSAPDAYSDLYAQLGNEVDSRREPAGEAQQESGMLDVPGKGSATPPYAKIKKLKSIHPYSKIKKKAEREHPYASVRNVDGGADGDETDTDSYDVIETRRRSVIEEPHGNPGASAGPAPPPRGRRPVTSFELGAGPSSPERHRRYSFLPGVEQNPAGPADEQAGAEVADGPHFSGDSQDSRGYSSITVRESLALLKARIAQENLPTRSGRPGTLVTRQESMNDPNYATVSEAEYSENLYSAIPDPFGNVYNSSAGGSETYARVDQFPSGGVASSSAAALGTPLEDAPPEPPSVISLKHLSLASRQGSMMSMLSVSSNLNAAAGSPKPERRKANSPLPPPPSPHNGDTYATVNKGRRNSRSLAEHGRTAVKSLEEMYAKVLKRKSASLSRTSDAGFLSQSEASSHRGSLDLGQLNFTQEHKKGHTKTNSGPSGLVISRRGSTDTFGSRQSLAGLNSSVDHLNNFPSLPEEMNYEAVRNGPGYEQIREKRLESEEAAEGGRDPGYERVKEPGYEALKDEVDPRYERLRDGGGDELSAHRSDPGYEAIEQYAHNLSGSDPAYETVPGSDLNQEPGYESLSAQESNYEPLHFDNDTRNAMYEELGFRDGREPNYESVKYFIGEPPYEQVGSVDNYETLDDFQNIGSNPPGDMSHLYSKVVKAPKREQESVPDGSVCIHIDGATSSLESSRSDNVVRIEVGGSSWTML